MYESIYNYYTVGEFLDELEYYLEKNNVLSMPIDKFFKRFHSLSLFLI